jgi:hypothetical protein
VDGAVNGVGKCTVFGAVCGIGSAFEDDPVFGHVPATAAAMQLENALGLQLEDYGVDVTAIDVRLVGDALSANPGNPHLNDPRARFLARLRGVAGDREQHPKFTAG